jgi:hypothetical protein
MMFRDFPVQCSSFAKASCLVCTAKAVLLPQIANNNLIIINSWIPGSTSIRESLLSLVIPDKELFIALRVMRIYSYIPFRNNVDHGGFNR